MSTLSLARPSRNGHTTIVPLLAAKVDQLHRLRTRLAEGQAAERELTEELLGAMGAHGLARLAGLWAVATVDEETSWTPLAALTPAERRALGEDDVHPDDLEYVWVPVTRPVLQTAPAPKAVAS